MPEKSLIENIETLFNKLLDEGDKLSTDLTDSVANGVTKLTKEATVPRY